MTRAHKRHTRTRNISHTAPDSETRTLLDHLHCGTSIWKLALHEQLVLVFQYFSSSVAPRHPEDTTWDFRAFANSGRQDLEQPHTKRAAMSRMLGSVA